MLTTAKSIQLLDASGMNISPITDITSLYYEVENPSDKRIISRKYVYDAFPVGVNINPSTLIKIGRPTKTTERHPDDGSLYDNGQLYKIVDDNDNDILVSKVDTDIIPGTTLRELKVTNYNLSDILSYYTPLDLMDASYGELIEDISIINASIGDVSNRIANLKASLDASSATLSEIINWRTKGYLIPNKFYLINDYYAGGDGCMALPDSEDFSGPNNDSSLSLLIKANDATTLDGKLYEMYDNNKRKALKVHGTYKIENNKVHITYMKDQYGNEAPYDFYNLKYKPSDDETFYYTFGPVINSNKINVLNNIIKTNPYSFKMMPILDKSNNIEKPITIAGNFIGIDNYINICNRSVNASPLMIFANNKIDNFNHIIINCSTNKAPLIISKIYINNNNNISSSLNISGTVPCIFGQCTINNNNNIEFKYNINKNININSSNNITLYDNASNVTILNNCDGSINLSNNIVVDNYIDTTNSSLNTSPNSVYLFGQDVYAKSFNTLK